MVKMYTRASPLNFNNNQLCVIFIVTQIYDGEKNDDLKCAKWKQVVMFIPNNKYFKTSTVPGGSNWILDATIINGELIDLVRKKFKIKNNTMHKPVVTQEKQQNDEIQIEQKIQQNDGCVQKESSVAISDEEVNENSIDKQIEKTELTKNEIDQLLEEFKYFKVKPFEVNEKIVYEMS